MRVSFTDDAGNDETLTSAATATVKAKANSPATGLPTVGGVARVGETLTADTSGISDADGLTNVIFNYQWLVGGGWMPTATGSTYTMAVADEHRAIRVRVSFIDDAGFAESLTSVSTTIVPPPATCPGSDSAPTPTAVEVGAVPIVVESTAEEYFVLYVRQELDTGATVEIPVSVTLGQDGTTTLTEQLPALPSERYRVEGYLVAEPADVDGDCIDDVTELADPVGMNSAESRAGYPSR